MAAKITQLETGIDKANCKWAAGLKPESAKEMLKDILLVENDATPLERSALGLCYQAVFGDPAEQLHPSFSALHNNLIDMHRLLLLLDGVVQAVCVHYFACAVNSNEIWRHVL